MHTFTGLVLRKRGNQRITITDTLNSFLSGQRDRLRVAVSSVGGLFMSGIVDTDHVRSAEPGRAPRPLRRPRPPPSSSITPRPTASRPCSRQLGASLLVSTYQANKLLVARADGGRAVDAGAHVRPAHGPGGGCPAADDRHPRPDLVRCATPRTSPRASSRPGSTTPAICRAPATSPGTSASTRWPGPATSCGWSTPASPACARWTPTTASCRAGGRRSSPPWPPRTAAI